MFRDKSRRRKRLKIDNFSICWDILTCCMSFASVLHHLSGGSLLYRIICCYLSLSKLICFQHCHCCNIDTYDLSSCWYQEFKYTQNQFMLNIRRWQLLTTSLFLHNFTTEYVLVRYRLIAKYRKLNSKCLLMLKHTDWCLDMLKNHARLLISY